MKTTAIIFPLYWEPVTGTGERLTCGAIIHIDGKLISRQLLREDTLECLYGSQASNSSNLIQKAIEMHKIAIESGAEKCEFFGISQGSPREIQVQNEKEAWKVVVLMYSSLSSLDYIESEQDSSVDNSLAQNKRFATKIKEEVIIRSPALSDYFSRKTPIREGGEPVNFGFASHTALVHFGTLVANRTHSCLKDARAKLWELSNARDYLKINNVALVIGYPILEDITLGNKQILSIKKTLEEIEVEADRKEMRMLPVNSIEDAAEKVIKLAA